MSAIVRALGLGKRFGCAAPVLDGLDFEVPEDSVFGLIGPNGAGKTTTIKILMNILQPSAGRAEELGMDSSRLGPDDYAGIGYVSENQEMPEWMTLDYLLQYLKPFYPTWDKARGAELVRHFDLPPGRKLRHLSRGMWMKTAGLPACVSAQAAGAGRAVQRPRSRRPRRSDRRANSSSAKPVRSRLKSTSWSAASSTRSFRRPSRR